MQLHERDMQQSVAKEGIKPRVPGVLEMLNNRVWYAFVQGIPGNQGVVLLYGAIAEEVPALITINDFRQLFQSVR